MYVLSASGHMTVQYSNGPLYYGSTITVCSVVVDTEVPSIVEYHNTELHTVLYGFNLDLVSVRGLLNLLAV